MLIPCWSRVDVLAHSQPIFISVRCEKKLDGTLKIKLHEQLLADQNITFKSYINQ